MSQQTRKALGERIRAARRTRLDRMPLDEFGRQLARAMGRARPFSNVTVSNWETGRQEPSWEALISIARLTNLPLDYFAGVGNVDDFPRATQIEGDAHQLGGRLRSLLDAIQRQEPARQRLILRQVEQLLATLREERHAEAVPGSGASPS